MKLHRWNSSNEARNSVFDYMLLEESEEWEKGISIVDSLSEEIICKENYYEKLSGLADNLSGAGYPVVSPKLKSFLAEQLDPEEVEFLPVTLQDHKEQILHEEYYLIHALQVVDCIDVEASGAVWNPLDESSIMHYKVGLVIQESKVPNELKLFRLMKHGHVIAVRSDLVKQIEQAGFTGLYFPDLEGYTGSG